MKKLTLTSPPSSDSVSIIRWPGAKHQLCDHLCSILLPALEQGGTYFEPFAGSLAVFFGLRARGWKGYGQLGDWLLAIANLYQQIQKDPLAVFESMRGFESQHVNLENKKNSYESTRMQFNQMRLRCFNPLYAGLFLWLNHRCFNGLWRTNKNGQMNSPFGEATKTYLPSLENMQVVQTALTNSSVVYESFQERMRYAKQGDVIYADPPYAQGFSEYAGKFTRDDQISLAECLKAAWQRGCTVVASNSNTPYIRELYDWCEITEVPIRYTIAAGPTKRVKEILIVGRPK